jgi:SWI/SNF-related matrix-associated actin-dependent regulator of chromatin subfamily A-like protein 1
MTIKETKFGYEANFEYDYFKVKEIKAIPGSYWRSRDKTWIIPKFQEHRVKQLLVKYKIGELDPETAAVLAPESTGLIPELPDLSSEYKEQLEKLPRKPFPFQEKGIAYNLLNKRTIIGDQPGLGKTLQAILTVTLAQSFPCLVICPSTLKLNWQKEWMEVAGKKAMLLTDRVKKTWHQYYNVGMIDIFIVNYESLKKYFVAGINKPEGAALRLNNIIFNDTIQLFKSVIIDESHKCKDGSTQQSKFCMGIARGKEYILELTGTPVVNKPKDLIAQLHILGRLGEVVSHIPANPKKKDGGYTRFINRYCGGGNDATNLQELNFRLSITCFYRREKTEVLKDLPPKMRQVVLCEISNRTEYTKAETQFVEYLKEVKGCTDAEIRKKLRGQFMVQMGILKQISARGKMNEVKDYVDEIIESGEKIILFCHHKVIVNGAANVKGLKELYPHAVSITGDDDMEARNNAVKKFQNDPKTNVIICSIKAAGVGLTLTASSRVAFIEFPWTFADCEQCEDRAHRIGQLDSVQCAYFLGENTIDRYCYYDIIQKKKGIARTITGASDDVQEEIIDELLNLFNQK